MNFECPECGSDKIVSVLFGVTITTPIIEVEYPYGSEDNVLLEIDEPQQDGGEQAFYQCGGCGHQICDDSPPNEPFPIKNRLDLPIENELDLAKYLKKRNMI